MLHNAIVLRAERKCGWLLLLLGLFGQSCSPTPRDSTALLAVALLPRGPLCSVPGGTHDHATLANESDVPARGAANKDAPCGVNVRGATYKTLVANNNMTIRWAETVDHPGRYWIEFSPANDTGWVRLRTVEDTQNGTGLHCYTETVPVPNENCDACTIRVVQEMLEYPASPTYYYSCGDIRITGATP